MRARGRGRHQGADPRPARLDRAQTVQLAAENFADRMLSDEAREGVASFVEKRKPNWVVDP